MELLFGLLLISLGLGVSFIVTAALVWLACWAFALAFTWKIAFGIWIVLILVRGIFSVTVKKD